MSLYVTVYLGGKFYATLQAQSSHSSHNHFTKHLTTPSKRGIMYKSVERSRGRISYPVTICHNRHNALDRLT